MVQSLTKLIAKAGILLVNSQTISLLFVGLSILLIWRNFEELPIAVPLWFSRPWGEERLAETGFLWIIPGVSLVLIIINFVLGKFFENREPVLSRILLWSNVIVSLLFFYTLFEIIRVAS